MINFLNPVADETTEVQESSAQIEVKPEEGKEVTPIKEETPNEEFDFKTFVEENKEESPQESVKEPNEETPIKEEESEGSEEMDLFISDDNAASIANDLFKQGLIKDVPKEVDLKNFTQESLVKTLKHNQLLEANELAETQFKNFVNKIGANGKDILELCLANPNITKEEIANYIGDVNGVNYLTSLNVEKDQSLIVKEYYKSLGWDGDRVDEKIADLIKLEKLDSEAKLLKPELDKRANSIITNRQKEMDAIQSFENERIKGLETKVVNTLKDGTLMGVELSRENVEFLATAVMNEETPATLPGGKEVRMGYAEALVRHHRFSEKGNLENLMLGLLIMKEGPKAVEKFIANKTREKETQKFIFENQHQSKKKKAGTQPAEMDLGKGSVLSFKNLSNIK